MGINLKKLATELNLSISTVSRALQDSHQVSEKTKQKVLALAKQLNFEPNPNASSLRRQKSKTLAVVIPDIDSNFNSQVIYGIEEAAQQKGYHILLYFTHGDIEKEIGTVRHLLSGRADGILMSVSSQTTNFEHLTEIQNNNIPIVIFDTACETLNLATVSTDDYKSGVLAAHNLLENGCTRIAYLKTPGVLPGCEKMFDGFAETLNRRGITIDNNLVLACTRNPVENYNIVKKLVTGKYSPEGIFASNEKLALTCYQVCHDLKIAIPEQLKIIALSNLEAAPLLSPSLTTISRPAFDMGKEATRIVLQMIKADHNTYNEKILLETQLEVRRSTSVNG